MHSFILGLTEHGLLRFPGMQQAPNAPGGLQPPAVPSEGPCRVGGTGCSSAVAVDVPKAHAEPILALPEPILALPMAAVPRTRCGCWGQPRATPAPCWGHRRRRGRGERGTGGAQQQHGAEPCHSPAVPPTPLADRGTLRALPRTSNVHASHTGVKNAPVDIQNANSLGVSAWGAGR